MVCAEVDISLAFPMIIDPEHPIVRVQLLGIDALFLQGHFVLFVVVRGRWGLDQPQEDWDGVAGKVGARMPVKSQWWILRVGGSEIS